MKRLLMLVGIVFTVLAISACAADTTVVDQLESSVASLESSVATLESQLQARQQELQTVQNDLRDLQNSIDVNYDEIMIIHTNDIHGRVQPSGSVLGLAKISTIVNNVRNQYAYTFLVDGGDTFHGTTFATIGEGLSVLRAMNAVGYDLMVAGNHDFNYGQDRLLELSQLANFPILAANVRYTDTGDAFLNPYVIQNFGGVRVGFFGMASPETLYKTHPRNVEGLDFVSPIESAREMVSILSPITDVIVMLAHVGIDEDTIETTIDVATAVPGIDIIIDGHSHNLLPEGLRVGNTLIAQAGEYGQNVGAVAISRAPGFATRAFMLDATDVEPDPYVENLVDLIATAQDDILNVEVGSTAVLLEGTRGPSRTSETNLGRILTNAMLLEADADVAFTNGGGIRASIQPGVVTLRDIISVLPFGNIITTIEVTGADIVAALEHGTSAAPNESGGFPHVAGLTYTLDLDAPEGERVKNVVVGGTPINLTRTYRLATNDFLAAGGDQYSMFAGRPMVGRGAGLHEALELAFRQASGNVVVPTDQRLTIIGGE